jgi:hypothetical protein
LVTSLLHEQQRWVKIIISTACAFYQETRGFANRFGGFGAPQYCGYDPAFLKA